MKHLRGRVLPKLLTAKSDLGYVILHFLFRKFPLRIDTSLVRGASSPTFIIAPWLVIQENEDYLLKLLVSSKRSIKYEV